MSLSVSTYDMFILLSNHKSVFRKFPLPSADVFFLSFEEREIRVTDRFFSLSRLGFLANG